MKLKKNNKNKSQIQINSKNNKNRIRQNRQKRIKGLKLFSGKGHLTLLEANTLLLVRMFKTSMLSMINNYSTKKLIGMQLLRNYYRREWEFKLLNGDLGL